MAQSSTPSPRRVASIDTQREREVAVTHPTQGRVAHRAREADLAPLHLDLTKGADAVARAVAASLEPRSKHRATAASSDGDRLLACVASLPRRSRELLERSAAEAATARAAYRAAHSAALAATPPPPSPVSSPVAAPPANKKGPPRDTDGLLAAAPRLRLAGLALQHGRHHGRRLLGECGLRTGWRRTACPLRGGDDRLPIGVRL